MFIEWVYLTFETLQKGTKKNHKYVLSTSCFKVYTRNECSNALWILTDQIIFVSKLFNFVRTTGLHPFVILSDISCFKHQMEVLRATSHERLSTWPIHKWPLLMAIAGWTVIIGLIIYMSDIPSLADWVRASHCV